jgi:hypothetical protein
VKRANNAGAVGVDAPPRGALRTHECVLKEGRDSRLRRCPSCDVLQFVRIHQTLKVTPAMAVDITDLWEMNDMVD